MIYSEKLISKMLDNWQSQGYTSTIVVDQGLLYAIELEEYFPASAAREDSRVNFYDENMSGPAWSMHAVTINGYCKGVLLMGGEMYAPWELTPEIVKLFSGNTYLEMPALPL